MRVYSKKYGIRCYHMLSFSSHYHLGPCFSSHYPSPPNLPLSCTGVTIGFDPDSYSVDEGGNVVFTIVKQGVNTIPVSVTFSTVDGTASGG